MQFKANEEFETKLKYYAFLSGRTPEEVIQIGYELFKLLADAEKEEKLLAIIDKDLNIITKITGAIKKEK